MNSSSAAETAETNGNTNLQPEFRGYASLYREALNSNSSVYQFFVPIQDDRSDTKAASPAGGRSKESRKAVHAQTRNYSG
jgi:hypothetical protein